MKTSRFIPLMLFIFTAMIVAAAGQTRPDQKTESERFDQLRSRVNMYWKLVIQQRLDQSYSLLTAQSRQDCVLVKYIKQNNVHCTDFTIGELNLDPGDATRASAVVLFSGTALGYPLKGVRTRQDWRWENGDWSLVYHEKKLFASHKKAAPAKKGAVDLKVLEHLQEMAKKINKEEFNGKGPSFDYVERNRESLSKGRAATAPAPVKTKPDYKNPQHKSKTPFVPRASGPGAEKQRQPKETPPAAAGKTGATKQTSTSDKNKSEKKQKREDEKK